MSRFIKLLWVKCLHANSPWRLANLNVNSSAQEVNDGAWIDKDTAWSCCAYIDWRWLVLLEKPRHFSLQKSAFVCVCVSLTMSPPRQVIPPPNSHTAPLGDREEEKERRVGVRFTLVRQKKKENSSLVLTHTCCTVDLTRHGETLRHATLRDGADTQTVNTAG